MTHPKLFDGKVVYIGRFLIIVEQKNFIWVISLNSSLGREGIKGKDKSKEKMTDTGTNRAGQEGVPFRKAMTDSARLFKSNWVHFGSNLTKVATEKLYEGWGYGSFEDYCRDEINLRKATAMKLTSAFFFLSEQEPAYLTNPDFPAPDLESISVLQKAKEDESFSEDNYENLKEAVFEKGLSASTISRQYKKNQDLGKETVEEDSRKKLLTQVEKLRMELLRFQHEQGKDIPFDFEGYLNQIFQFLENRLD